MLLRSSAHLKTLRISIWIGRTPAEGHKDLLNAGFNVTMATISQNTGSVGPPIVTIREFTVQCGDISDFYNVPLTIYEFVCTRLIC